MMALQQRGWGRKSRFRRGRTAGSGGAMAASLGRKAQVGDRAAVARGARGGDGRY